MDREYAPPRLAAYPGGEQPIPWRRSVRARVFALSGGLTLLLGIGLTLLQPSVYRASATVLMTAPVAIDDRDVEADVQDVAIQRRILLGSEVTGRLREELAGEPAMNFDATELRRLLRVEPVADTNLVEMAAQGEESGALPALVDRWIDVYLEIRAENVQQSHQHTLQVVRDQLAGLEVKLDEAREALAQYREQHDITSSTRQENEVVARLEGLNAALNKAIDEEVRARAQLRTLENAIAEGKRVVSANERESVVSMENELRQLRAQLTGLTKNYTMEYIRKQPRYRDIPDRIEELEDQLEEAYREGEERELATARRQFAAAEEAVNELQEKLDAHEREAARFTTIYARHEALVQDLARLEELNRETRSRMIEVQVNPVDRYPQVSVIDRPGTRSVRLGPDYRLWLGGSVAAALVVGILSVWLYGFLGPREPKPAFVTLSGVHMYPQDVNAQLGYSAQGIAHAGGPRLGHGREDAPPREPRPGEPEEGADDMNRQKKPRE